ncbi:MAG: InlB B-repeat-containing protein [Kiritimatiellia bacterium]
MNIGNFMNLPGVRRLFAGGALALAGAFLLATPAQATTVRLNLGANGTYATAYSDDEWLEVTETVRTATTPNGSAGETWYLSAETSVAGYMFDQWKVTPSAAAADVAIDDAFAAETTAVLGAAPTYIFTASFKKIQKTLTVSHDGHAAGLVPTEGAHLYDLNRIVKLGTPTPQAGYVFDHWAHPSSPDADHPNVVADYSGTRPAYSIVMDDDYEIMAVFKRQLSITHRNYDPTMPAETLVEAVGEGTRPTVTVPNETVQVSDSERYSCVGWTQGGPQIPPAGGSTSYEFIQPITNDNSLAWAWRKQYCVIGGIANGYGDIAGLNTAIGNNQNWFDAGSTINVSAIPAAGYVFAGWIANPPDILPPGATGSRTLSLQVDQGFTLLASFQLLSSDSDGDGLPDSWETRRGPRPLFRRRSPRRRRRPRQRRAEQPRRIPGLRR